MLDQRREQVYTVPDNTRNDMTLLNLTGNVWLNDKVLLTGLVWLARPKSARSGGGGAAEAAAGAH